MAVILRYLYWGILWSSMIACSATVSSERKGKFDFIDSVFSAQVQLVLHQPDSAVRWVLKSRMNAPDSLSYYYWTLNLGRCYYYNSKLDSVLKCMENVNVFCKRNPVSEDVATLSAAENNIRGIVLQTMNDRHSALVCFRDAYRDIIRASSRKEIFNICINAANVCEQLGKFSEATVWYYKALQVVDSLNIKSGKHTVYSGLGRVYAYINNFPQAEYYYHLVDSLYPPCTAYEVYVYYTSRCNCYNLEEKYPESLACAQKAYRAASTLRVQSAVATAEGNLGDCFLRFGQLDSARYYLDKAYVYFSSDPNADDALLFYIQGLYADWALKKNDIQTAGYYLSLPFVPQRIGSYYLYLHYKRLMEFYSKKEDFAKAFHYQKIVNRYDDSLRNVRYQNSVAEIGYRYRRDTALLKRDLIIAGNNNKLAELQTMIAIGAALLLLLVSVAVLFYRYLRSRHERQRREQLILITRLRMENVRNRFSPHFVFNVLNVILPALGEYENAAVPLRQLVQALRGNLLIVDKIAIPLSEELNMVRSYVVLRQITMPDIPVVRWSIDPEVNQDWLLPSMVVQVAVENALKHAFPSEFPEGDEKLIDIKVYNEDDLHFRIVVEDNGVGYTYSDRSQSYHTGTGNGIRIIYRTIQLLNEQNMQKITIAIQDRSADGDRKQGTRVLISVPHPYNYEI